MNFLSFGKKSNVYYPPSSIQINIFCVKSIEIFNCINFLFIGEKIPKAGESSIDTHIWNPMLLEFRIWTLAKLNGHF